MAMFTLLSSWQAQPLRVHPVHAMNAADRQTQIKAKSVSSGCAVYCFLTH